MGRKNLEEKLAEAMPAPDWRVAFRKKLDSSLAFTTDLDGLTEALTINAQAYSYFAQEAVKRRNEAKQKSEAMRTIEAELYGRQQEILTADLGKAPSIERIKASVKSHPHYILAVRDAAKADELAEMCVEAKFAFEHRLRAVSEVAKLLRVEIESGMASASVIKTRSVDLKRKVDQAMRDIDGIFA